jgi:cyanoexosortase A
LGKLGDIAHLGMSVLFCLAVASLLWEKRTQIKLKSKFLPTLLGFSLIAWILIKSFSISTQHDPWLRISPFVMALGLSFIASGFRGLKQFQQEITILFFLGVPHILISSFIDISAFTAKTSALILWCLGFDVSVQGIYLNLPTASIKVYPGCSGIEAMLYLLGLAVICLVIFPLRRHHKIVVPIVAVILGFAINGLRIALLAALVASNQLESFDYWHEGDGSLIFGLISVLIFGLFYMFLIRQSK